MELYDRFKQCTTQTEAMQVMYELNQEGKYSREDLLKAYAKAKVRIESDGVTVKMPRTLKMIKSKFYMEQPQYFPNVYKGNGMLVFYSDGSIEI